MFTQTTLKNGIPLITSQNNTTNTVTILIMIKTGSNYESKEINGISHFLEHLMFKGTKKYPTPHDLAIALDNLGGEFNAYTGEEFTGYFIKVEHTKTEAAIALLAEMLQNSTFPEEEINRERNVIIEEINMIHDEPMKYIYYLFTKALYGDTPAGREIIGPKENIKNISRNQILNYLKTQYNTKNTIISIAGNITNPEELANKYFIKQNSSNGIIKEDIAINQSKPNILIKSKKTDQTHLQLGFHAFAINDKDEIPLRMLAKILGGSMSSRLFTELREKQGLAYYVRSFADFHTSHGYIASGAGIPLAKIDLAIKIIIKEYSRFKTELVDEKELNKVKTIIKGKLAIQLEQSDEVAEWLAESHTLRNKIQTPQEFINKVEKVSAEDIKRVANALFVKDKLNLAIIGDVQNQNDFNELLVI